MDEPLSFWEELKKYMFATSRARNFRDKTTARVTFFVIALLAYVVWIVSSGAEGSDGAGIVTERFDADGNVTERITGARAVNPDYVDLLSDIALIIAASFTTVIGYYFGNRNAEKDAKEVTAQAIQEVEAVEKKNAELRDQLRARGEVPVVPEPVKPENAGAGST